MKKFKIIFFISLVLSAGVGAGVGVGAAAFASGSQEKQAKIPTVKNLDEFAGIAIQEEGRIKPLDTYARTVLLQFSGKRTFEEKPAIHWLAKLLFTPWATSEDQVFLINSPEIPMALGIEPDPHRRYSFSQLEPGLSKLKDLAVKTDAIDPKMRSIVDQEILRVYNNLVLYAKLRGGLLFTIPHPDFAIQEPSVKAMLEFLETKTEFSFLDIALKADLINEETQALEKKKSGAWSAEEKELMRLLRSLYQWSLNASGSPLTIMPPLNRDDESWVSPWDMLQQNFTDPQIRKELVFFQSMTMAYSNTQQLEFDLSVKGFNSAVGARIPASQKEACRKIPLEIFYNHSNLFFYARIFYVLAFFAFLLFMIEPQVRLQRVGLLLVVMGFVPHGFAMILRMVMMARPPVTNLYETFIFVGAIAVFLGILTELVNRKGLGIVVASIAGFIALTIADKFSAEGDTLRMLVAVLNSNFWLSTHVLSITTGYAGCCVAGILGHVYIIQALLRPPTGKMLETTYQHILGILGFGLTMSFLGTMLGGIWADQSWGRFWGWDPKENGALLIVLWCAIVFHAKSGRMISQLGVAVGAVLTLLVVMWAWFGVNVLSIGLHSYGFTSGLATHLAIYVVLEFLFLGIGIWLLRKKNIFL